jgi:hypothetical protein
MRLNNLKPLFIVFLAFSMATISCSTAKFQQGFSYQPAVEGPSIGSNQSNEAQIQPNELQQKVEQPIASITTNRLNEMVSETSDHYEFVDFEVFASPDGSKFLLKSSHKPNKESKFVTDFIVYNVSTMEKLWKAREKQLEKVLLNASHIRGSIEGIAGADAVNLNLLDDAVGLLE